jgi:hypothetical protein
MVNPFIGLRKFFIFKPSMKWMVSCLHCGIINCYISWSFLTKLQRTWIPCIVLYVYLYLCVATCAWFCLCDSGTSWATVYVSNLVSSSVSVTTWGEILLKCLL